MLSPTYLLQQLQIGSFLGIVAAGMMMVILIAQIDLSVPWTLAAAAMMATAVGGPLAIPVGLAVGLLVGLVNGLGVAYLRVPSMIFTLGVNAVMRGLMVAHTGGYAPQTAATDLMRTARLGTHIRHPQRPLRLGAVSAGGRDHAAAHCPRPLHLRHRQQGGRGLSRRRRYAGGVTVICFALCGLAAGLAGVLLAGYSTKAYQAWATPICCPRSPRS